MWCRWHHVDTTGGHLDCPRMCAAIDVEGTQQESNKRQTYEDRTCEYIPSRYTHQRTHEKVRLPEPSRHRGHIQRGDQRFPILFGQSFVPHL
jgi:hypothetical protein